MGMMVLLTGLIMFLMAVLGIMMNSSSLILILMSLEIMLLSISLLFIFSGFTLDLFEGQLFVLMMLTIAACESAMGLTIMITYYSITGHITVKLMSLLKG